MPRRDRSDSVARAFEILGLVAEASPDGVSLSGLSRSSGLPVSTCHRYVTSLLDLAVLDKDAGGRLRLGVGLVTLAGRYLEDDVLRTFGRPVLMRLSEESGETVHLGTFTNDSVTYVDKIDSEQSIRLVSRIGSQVPLYCTSMGKAILSRMPDEYQEKVVLAAAERRTPYTLLGGDLRRELARAREAGWAIDDQENEMGVRCLGVAILSSSGEPIGALSVSGPAHRLSPDDCERLAPFATAAAAEIGQQIGWRHVRPVTKRSEGALT